MSVVLGRKQTSRQRDWLAAYENAARRYPDHALDVLIDRTVDRIRRDTAGSNVAFGWSGGKDSLALEYVMRLAGVEQCVLAMSDLEYPAFLAWATDLMPPELEIVDTGQDLEWLVEHQDMLFPRDAKTAGTWFRIVQHTGQMTYFKRHRLDFLALGRRRADGNYVGPARRYWYTDQRGVVRYSPLHDWPHEAVLALIVREKIRLPPNYQWPRGFIVGTGPWPARQFCPTIDDGWAEIDRIDRRIVIEASDLIDSAKRYLDRAS